MIGNSEISPMLVCTEITTSKSINKFFVIVIHIESKSLFRLICFI